MLAGVRIALLYRLRQGEQNALGFFERIDKGLIAEHGADARPYHGRMQRLDQELVGARGDADNLVFSTPCTLVIMRIGTSCVARVAFIQRHNSGPLTSGSIKSRITRCTFSDCSTGMASDALRASTIL